MDFRSDFCEGTLYFHRDSTVSCTEALCRTTTADAGLGSHSCVMSCRDPLCSRCSSSDAREELSPSTVHA